MSSLGVGSGTYAMEDLAPAKDLVTNEMFEINKKYAKISETKLADCIDFGPEGSFCKIFESQGISVTELPLEKKEELFKNMTKDFLESIYKERWPKFLGEIEKNPTEVILNVAYNKIDLEVLDFIEKNYDEIEKKLPSDWLSLVKELYSLDDKQVAATRECIDKGIIEIGSIYGTKVKLKEFLGNRNMVFQYFMLCRSKTGGSISLDEAKSKMDDKSFFNSCIKLKLDGYNRLFTKDVVGITNDMREKGLLKFYA